MIALIVGRHGHDGPGAVAHQHIVGDPDGNAGLVDRVDRMGAGEDPGLFLGQVGPFEFALVRGGADIAVDRLPLFRGGQRPDEGVFRGKHHVGGAEKGVRPGREHAQGLPGQGFEAENDFRTFRSSDPVALHQLDRFRPVDQLEILKQPLGVAGDPQHPLFQRPFVDRVIAPFGAALVRHLFIGENGPERRAPVDRNFRHVGEALAVEDASPAGRIRLCPDRGPCRGRCRQQFAGFRVDRPSSGVEILFERGEGSGLLLNRIPAAVEELEKDPLGPAVEADIRGGDAALLVVTEAEAVELPAHVRDVPVG